MRLQKLLAAALGISLITAACTGDSASAGANTAEAATATTTEAAAPVAAAAGNVIEVKMVTDGQGNYFEPASIEAKPGDVLRFVLVSGVHNVSFPVDQNANAVGLPGPSQFAQLPGQTIEVPVSFGPGEYKFQCDPHAALGMVGTVRVAG